MNRCARSLEYKACHEAGHAVARVLLTGATLVLVDAVNCITEYKIKAWRCTCSVGFLTPGAGGAFTFHFDPVCDSCTEYVTNHLAGNYSGMVATGILMPSEHQLSDMEDDVAAAGEFYQPYAHDPNIWTATKTAALVKAESLVRAEKGAVLAVRNALVRSGGVLHGPTVESIIAANRCIAQNGAQNGAQ